MFVMPTEEISIALRLQLRDLRKQILLVDLQDLVSQRLDARVDLNYLMLTLREALKQIAEQKKTKHGNECAWDMTKTRALLLQPKEFPLCSDSAPIAM